MNKVLDCLIIGACAVLASSYSDKLPEALDVGAFPVRKYASAAAGAYAGLELAKLVKV